MEGWIGRSESPFNIGGKEWYITVQVAPGGNGTRYLCCDGELRGIASDPDGIAYYPTEAEARYRLLLYTDPAKALQPFLTANNLEYEGTCARCREFEQLIEDGLYPESFRDFKPDCPTCHGTGGPPAQHLLEGAADWFWERGCEMEASVLKSLLQGEAK